MTEAMRDDLYQVTTPYFCARFVVAGGHPRGAARAVVRWRDSAGDWVLPEGCGSDRGADLAQLGRNGGTPPGRMVPVRPVGRIPPERRDGLGRGLCVPGVHPRRVRAGASHTARLAEVTGIPTCRFEMR